jgi:hypothetical protein
MPLVERIVLGDGEHDIIIGGAPNAWNSNGGQADLSNLPRLQNLDFFYKISYVIYTVNFKDLPSLTSAAGLCGTQRSYYVLFMSGNLTSLCKAAVVANTHVQFSEGDVSLSGATAIDNSPSCTAGFNDFYCDVRVFAPLPMHFLIIVNDKSLVKLMNSVPHYHQLHALPMTYV